MNKPEDLPLQLQIIKQSSSDLMPLWLDSVIDSVADAFRTQIRWPMPLVLIFTLLDSEQMRAQNHRTRGVDAPTNVLSLGFEDQDVWMGDILICPQVIVEESTQQTLEAHAAHIVLHGCLHVIGYDHVIDADHLVMQQRENELMALMSYPIPWPEINP